MSKSKSFKNGVGLTLFALLYNGEHLYQKKFRQELLRLGLTIERYIILEGVYSLGDQASLSNIVRNSILESHTISALVSRMEQDALLVKRFFEKPRNMVMIELTEKGKKLTVLARQQTSVLEEIWKPFLSEDEVKLLIELLSRLENANIPVVFGRDRVQKALLPVLDRNLKSIKGYQLVLKTSRAGS